MEPQRALILTHARAHLAKGQYVFAKVCESRAACLLVHARVRTRRHAEAIAAPTLPCVVDKMASHVNASQTPLDTLSLTLDLKSLPTST